MPKPLGLGFQVREGALTFGVTKSTRAEDKIYDAVEEALIENLSVKQFMSIAREAWSTTLRDQANQADKEWDKK